jgi:hypothetical protein
VTNPDALLDGLNDEQREAALTVTGPLAILAGIPASVARGGFHGPGDPTDKSQTYARPRRGR